MMDQMADELGLDTKYESLMQQQDDDLEARLARLKAATKGTDKGANAHPPPQPHVSPNPHGGNVSPVEACPEQPPPTKQGCEEKEELWCELCCEDATVRCLDEDCEGDVFCAPCFKSMHRDPGMRGHRTEPISPREPRDS
eukprot:TRINITY_DN3523_c0_g1_i5.p2 TRINITY_DN3523_c0_g1~~TRINITY_DN3523_c0_g1_i5.p2  ORF type:complete len:140 (-),score=35.54 TRINITY_DN3523_c0_g1_i5:286-705(-)